MRQPEGSDRDVRPSEAEHKVRKPYQKPAVRHEHVFETRALTCGKMNATQGSCHFQRKTS
jgi:hypothetical protein